MTAQGFTDQGSTTSDNLLAGEFPRIAELATVSGGKYARGTILGKITTSGKCTICTSAATDGSKDAYAVLAEAVDTSEEDKQAVVYLTGEFNTAALTVGSGLTVDGLKDALRAKSIFIKNNQAY